MQPDAPGGTSEGLLGHVIREMQFEGRNALTFGASATSEIHPEYNLGGWKIRMLGKAYKKIVTRYGLANRGQFRVSFGSVFSGACCFFRVARCCGSLAVLSCPPRTDSALPAQAKFGTEDEPLHIAYPPNSFGWSGLVAMMKLMKV